MNWLKILVALAAFLVAGCAAYFSVTGLGVLFSGASVAVMIMASALEFSKLVAASYLKQVWDEIGGFLKFYFVLAVVILMIITSAGIFGYLSNAFQQQNLKIQQVDREIAIWQSKVSTNKEQIEILNQQLNNFQQNQGKIIDLQQGNSANSRLLRSVDNRDKQIAETSNKIDVLQSEIVQYNDTINKIKTANIDVEREVGGFRFVAEAFGVELNTVVKFFIFLIVFVFNPMAIALVIAFNNLIKKKSPEITKEGDNKLYKIYGDTQEIEKSEIIEDNEEEIVENSIIEELNEEKIEETEKNEDQSNWLNAYNGMPYYTNPEFPWEKTHLWQNDQKAVKYWMNNKGMSNY
jgi:DNA-directed RNA polymerase beta' subunit